MKYCQHCGAEINENAAICLKCGCSVQSQDVDNSVSVGLAILSVFIPLFGIIYWPVKAKERPKCAKACGIAAIISWIAGILISVIFS